MFPGRKYILCWYQTHASLKVKRVYVRHNTHTNWADMTRVQPWCRSQCSSGYTIATTCWTSVAAAQTCNIIINITMRATSSNQSFAVTTKNTMENKSLVKTPCIYIYIYMYIYIYINYFLRRDRYF